MRRTWRNSSGAACGIRFTMILILMLVMVFGAAGAVFADDSGVNSKPTLQELRDRYNALGTPPLGEAMYETPVNVSAYTPATLTNASLTYAQNYINFMRYQAGLGEIALDSTLNANAAQGALILARLNSGLTHYPATPSGVTDAAAAPGKYAAAASNLSYSSSWPYPDSMSIIEDAILGQMKDERPQSNIDCLGHRRWLLKPSTSTMGIGSALLVNKGDWNKAYTDVRVMNGNNHQDSYGTVQGGNSTNYNFIAWPASGYMLNTVFDYRTPWSVQLNTSKYNAPESGTVQVEVTRRSDNKKWTLDSGSTNTISDGYIGSNYFNVNNQGYGEGYCIIFCPNPNELGSGKLDDIFDVKITGLSPKDSSVSSTIQYTVNFKGLTSAKSVTADMITLSPTSFTYNGSNQKPTVTVKDDATTLVEGTDYTLTNNGGTNVGTYNVVVTGTGNYTGSAQKSFSITAKKVAVPTAATGLTYTGQTQQGVAATADYTVSNGSATNVGNYTATLTLKDNTNTTWSDGGTANKTVQWSIAPKSVTESIITLSHTDFTYNGYNQKPTVTVKDGTTTLIEGTDYALTNNGGTGVGTYNVVVTGKGNYTGSAQKSYRITTKEITADMVELSQTEFIEDGNQHKPEVTVRDGEKILVEDSDYMLNNEGGKVIGTYNVVVKGRGNYRGEVTKQFSIEEPKTLIPIPSPKTGLVYNGGPQKGFDESPYYSITNGEQTDAGAYTATLELTDKTGTTWDDGGTTNKEVQWSIAPKSVTESMITLSPTSFTYNGSTQMPEVTVEDGSETLTKDTDYTLTNAGGTDVGTYTVSIAGKGNYSGNTSAAFEIAKAPNEITKFIVTGGTEGSNPFTITLESRFGKDTAVYTFSTSVDGDYTNTRPIKKGTYYAKVSIAETANYSGAKSGPIAFTISASRQDETEAIPKKGADPNQKGEDGTATGAGASAAAAEKAITGAKNDNDPAGSVFGKLRLKSNKQTKHAITLNWTKQKDAVKYVVYGNACGKKNNMKKLVTLDNKNAYTVKKISKKLKKGTYHKFIVVALDENETVVSTSKIIHVATKGGKVTNPKSVNVEKGKKAVSKLSVKAGKTAKLKGSVTKAGKNLQLKKYRAVVFETSNKEIATVSKSGKITAKDKGTCDIYAYAQDGKFKTIKLTVK